MLLLTALLLSLSAAAFSQMMVSGSVVDVVDAKTLTVAVPTGHVTIELQYIDVPDASDPMHASIKKHLRDLVAGKHVEYRTRSLSFDRAVAQVFCNDIDISQQMLRDGAAWHMPLYLSGQDPQGFSEYASYESAAKQEKRGIWAMPNLKPAWAGGSSSAPVKPVAAKVTVSAPSGYWSDKNPRLANIGALQHGFNASLGRGYVGIPLLGVNDPGAASKEYRTAVDIMYFYTEGAKGRTGHFAINVLSQSARWRFASKDQMVVWVDGDRVNVGRPKRVPSKDGGFFTERMTYVVDRKLLSRIANASEVVVVAGDYPMVPAPGLQMILFNLLDVAK